MKTVLDIVKVEIEENRFCSEILSSRKSEMGDIVKVEIDNNRNALRSKVSENPKFVQNMDYDVTMYLDNFVRFEKSKLRKTGFGLRLKICRNSEIRSKWVTL